jgi:FkbM family methyltransferase
VANNGSESGTGGSGPIGGPSSARRDYRTDVPWGGFRPDRIAQALLSAARGIPPLAKPLDRLAFLLRYFTRKRLSGPVDVHLWGMRLRLHPSGNISENRILFMPQFWDLRERNFLKRQVGREEFVFVDIGANVGAYTLWTRRWAGPTARILSVEPDPELAGALRFNARTNGFDNVEVVEVACSAEEGRGVLVRGARNRGGNRLALDEGEAEQTGLDVKTVPLLELLGERGIQRIDVLKIDIEGRELHVLTPFFESAPRSLYPAMMFVEMKPRPEYRQLEDLLRSVGYEPILRTRANWVFQLRDSAPDGAQGTD